MTDTDRIIEEVLAETTGQRSGFGSTAEMLPLTAAPVALYEATVFTNGQNGCECRVCSARRAVTALLTERGLS